MHVSSLAACSTSLPVLFHLAQPLSRLNDRSWELFGSDLLPINSARQAANRPKHTSWCSIPHAGSQQLSPVRAHARSQSSLRACCHALCMHIAHPTCTHTHRERPYWSSTMSARSTFQSRKWSLSICQVQDQGRLCTTTCSTRWMQRARAHEHSMTYRSCVA